MERQPADAHLSAWCDAHLGSAPATVIFRKGHLSMVWGLRLANDVDVVVKVRPDVARLAGCVAVHHHLFQSGFPCPEPLAGPLPIGDGLAATAESYVPGGEQIERDVAPERMGSLLASLVAMAPPVEAVPSLKPAPPWIGWDHDRHELWPDADDTDADLNAHIGLLWLDEAAQRVRSRLARHESSSVVGHGDWESQNLRWHDGTPHVVHDWDSVASRPEIGLVGAARPCVLPTAGRTLPPPSTRANGSSPLTRRTEERLSPTTSERRAGRQDLVRCFNVKKQSVSDPVGAEQFRPEAIERLERAGA